MNKHTAASTPYIAPIKATTRLRLEPAPNGGWVVTGDPKNPGMHPDMLGAFGCAADMLKALGDALGVRPAQTVSERREVFISKLREPSPEPIPEKKPDAEPPIIAQNIPENIPAEPIGVTPQDPVSKIGPVPEDADPDFIPRKVDAWTSDECRVALEMHAAGKTNGGIADALHRKAQAVGPKMRHLIARNTKLPPVEKPPSTAMSEAFDKALSAAKKPAPKQGPKPVAPVSKADVRPELDMGNGMGASERAVRRTIHAAGYPAPWTPALDCALFTSLFQGGGLDKAAKTIGVNRDDAKARVISLMQDKSVEGQRHLMETLRKLADEAETTA